MPNIEPDKILCDIIQTAMGLADGRVVAYSQNFDAPKDANIYVVVATGPTRVIGSSKRFNPSTNEEEKCISIAQTFNVEITSKNRDALNRKEEIVVALRSDYAQTKMEENQIAIFRTPQILDLSFIEGASSLHRYRIPVIIHLVKRYSNAVNYIDKYQNTEVLDEPS
jgi:hypothetical protein